MILLELLLIEFPSFEEAKNYYYSKEYKDGSTLFLKGTVVRHIQIVEGFNIV